MWGTSEDISIKVFIYHRIAKQKSGNGGDKYAVSVEAFRNQLKILDMFNFTPITFEDYQLYLEGKLTLPKKPVILTFDDGYLDIYENALPVLLEFDMKAVIFALGNRNLRYASWDQRNKGEAFPLMTDEQLLEMCSEEFEIGAHTMTHPKLPSLAEEAVVEEIMGSKQALEKLLGRQVLSFAYPYGHFDDQSYKITQKAGFKFACGISTGPARFGDDVFNIRRLAVDHKTGLVKYLMKLLTPYEYVEWMNYKMSSRHFRELDKSDVSQSTVKRASFDRLKALMNSKY